MKANSFNAAVRNMRARHKRIFNPRLDPTEIGMLIEALNHLASAYAAAPPKERYFASADVAAMTKRLVAAKAIIMVDGD